MIFFRKLKRNYKWFAINAIGLSTTLACMLIIYLYGQQELSYDRFHSKADRIYRMTAECHNGATSMHPARIVCDWATKMETDYPEIEKMVRLVPFRNAIIQIEDHKFTSLQAYSTDSSFFDVFDFKILSGSAEKAFSQPSRAFISRSLALKYFGRIDVVGKEIFIIHQQSIEPKLYTIDGVMEDFPDNSHFHVELLTSFATVEDQTTWAYTYFLLKKGTDLDALKRTVQKNWDDELGVSQRIVFFQKLTDIHLFSHKTREMEANGDIRSVILLVSGVFIILLIALINFVNLNRVQFIANIKSLKVRRINGASMRTIAMDNVYESMLLSVFSILIGWLIASKLCDVLKISVFHSQRIADVVLIMLGFIVVIALLAVIPLFTSKNVSDIKMTNASKNLYSYPLVLQFTLAMVAISCTLILNRQMKFINSQHPASDNANMVVIADNTWESVQRYELLKKELLSSSSILSMTAAMEEPGGSILDNCGFEMEGIAKNDGQSINIFTTDSNFFSSLNIQPIAGTTELGVTPSQQWETDAIELSNLRNNINIDKQKLADLEAKVGNYHEKYIINHSALSLLGIINPEDAIGKRFRLNFFLPDLFPEGEIVGVVPDFHYTNLHCEEKPLVIAPRKLFNYCFIIGIDPNQHEKAIGTLIAIWQKINPEFPLEYEYITDSYQKVYAEEYAQIRVMSLFSLISIILSALGIFAIAVFSIQRRTKEIGIRKVNGAGILDVMVMLNKDFVKWVALAFIIATPISWLVMTGWLENFAYKTELNWWIFVSAGLLAFGISILTVCWQSWQAASRNPVEALRDE